MVIYNSKLYSIRGKQTRSINFICDMQNIPSPNKLNSMQKEMLVRIFAHEFY